MEMAGGEIYPHPSDQKGTLKSDLKNKNKKQTWVKQRLIIKYIKNCKAKPPIFFFTSSPRAKNNNNKNRKQL